MKILLLPLLLTLAVCAAHAAVKTETISYRAGDAAMKGYLAYDDAATGRVPGVLVFHEWWGLNDYPKDRARALAAMGYVAFAADMFGDGKVGTTPDEAQKLVGQFMGSWDQGGRTLMRERARAALDVLAANPHVDPTRLAAIGYCFGGTTALELAYSGADLKGVVSFHGGLRVPAETDVPNIKAGLLILHGASDPSIKPETIAQLQSLLTKGNVDWQMVYYGGALHAFTNPANNDPNNTSAHYEPKAAARSWQAMQAFFSEVFTPPQ